MATAWHVMKAELGEVVLRTAGRKRREMRFAREGLVVEKCATIDIALFAVKAPPPGPKLELVWPPEFDETVGVVDVGVPPLGMDVGWVGFAESAIQAFGEPTVTFCRGRISAVGLDARDKETCLFLVDGNVNRGMSGGPVWDSRGEVLGLVRELWQPEKGSVHMGIVPIGYVLELFKMVRAKGVARE
ncbi:MAG: serine protease [Phycisphaerae bacterium]|nr:serine protease [Phycisphaerae bacterium]